MFNKFLFVYFIVLEMNRILDDELTIKHQKFFKNKTFQQLVFYIDFNGVQFKHKYIFPTLFINSKMHKHI